MSKINIKPHYNLFDIQMDVGQAEFDKGRKLFDSGKLTHFSGDFSIHSMGAIPATNYSWLKSFAFSASVLRSEAPL